MTQYRNVHNCSTHHHPFLQATTLRRICLIRLVDSGTQKRVKALWRNLECILIRKSVPLRRSQTPRWKSIEQWTRQTRRCIAWWKKLHLSLRQSLKSQNSIASETSEFTLRCTRAKPTPRSSGKWVLKPHKARYVLTGFEENVKDSTTMRASVRMLLCQATDLRNEGYSVHS